MIEVKLFGNEIYYASEDNRELALRQLYSVSMNVSDVEYCQRAGEC